MKRDMGLIRRLLIRTEEGPWDSLGETLDVVEHIRLMSEAGYITARCQDIGLQGKLWKVERLTWNGHDFLNVLDFGAVK